jgi:hypothetical protein
MMTVVTMTAFWDVTVYGGGIAQDVPYTATITDLLCFLIRVLIIPDLPTRAVWQ